MQAMWKGNSIKGKLSRNEGAFKMMYIYANNKLMAKVIMYEIDAKRIARELNIMSMKQWTVEKGKE